MTKIKKESSDQYCLVDFSMNCKILTLLILTL